MNGEKIKFALIGFVAGGIVSAIAGFMWGGWVTESTATKMAENASDQAVVSVLVPYCLTKAQADPGQLAELKKITNIYTRRTFVEKSGWVVSPEGASDSLTRSLARSCASAIDDDSKLAQAATATN